MYLINSTLLQEVCMLLRALKQDNYASQIDAVLEDLSRLREFGDFLELMGDMRRDEDI